VQLQIVPEQTTWKKVKVTTSPQKSKEQSGKWKSYRANTNYKRAANGRHKLCGQERYLLKYGSTYGRIGGDSQSLMSRSVHNTNQFERQCQEDKKKSRNGKQKEIQRL